MTYEQGVELMLDALKGIHGRFKQLYGQAAMRLDENTYLFTGSNRILAETSESDLVLCDVNTGGLGEILRSCTDIDSVLFGMSQDMVAVSDRDEPLDVTLEDLAQLTGAKLKVSADAEPANIISALEDTTVCLIKGIGGIAAGSNIRKAVAGIQIVEKACEAEIHGKLLGGTVPIEAELAERYRKDFETDYVNRNEEKSVPFVGFEEEVFNLRVQLIETGKKLAKQDLIYGSWGNLSVRIGDDEMLITPSSMDYFDIKPEDIVRLNINTLVYGDQRVPSSETSMHAAIYREIPDCGAVIHTHSNGLAVFAACEAGFSAGNQEIKEVIGEMLVTEKAEAGTPELAACVCETMKKTHNAIIPHHGAVFTGPSLEVTFRIAEAAEIMARNILKFDTGVPQDDELAE